jgi:tRNA (guanine-N7-)-methyltransferase
VSRVLKYDIPGDDWRLTLQEAGGRVRQRGWPELFAPGLASPKRLVVDIGFGRGEFLLQFARGEPESGFLGIERSFKRVLKMARRLARYEVRNVRLIESAAERVVTDLLPPESVACCWINFPDPWPKKRHHRRRLIAPAFVRDLASRLEPTGVLHIATDHVEYAAVIDGILNAEPRLENAYAPMRYRTEVPGRSPTAYETEWRAQGRALRFFCYHRA